RRLAAIGTVWRDHLDAVSAQLLVQGIAVVGAVTDQILGLGFDHVEVEAQLHIGGLRDGWAHACLPIAAIHGNQQSPCFSCLFRVSSPQSRPRHPCVASMKHSSSSSAPLSRSSLATSVSSRRIAAPSLKTPMYRFVVGIALRQYMPLRTCVEKPQDCFKNATCRDRLASGTTIGNVLLRKMIPDPLPLLVRESNHPIFVADRLPPAILR